MCVWVWVWVFVCVWMWGRGGWMSRVGAPGHWQPGASRRASRTWGAREAKEVGEPGYGAKEGLPRGPIKAHLQERLWAQEHLLLQQAHVIVLRGGVREGAAQGEA